MKSFKLFTTQSCPKCPEVKEFVKTLDNISVEMHDASTEEGLNEARTCNVTRVPTVIVYEDGKEIGRANSVEELKEYV